ncbi:DUF3014 domain-containing protein [Proteobacteria bacterium 005FR1]|nr:DUF3014 domain-containing protein [Proteobacteria bacterium 005FR1]
MANENSSRPSPYMVWLLVLAAAVAIGAFLLWQMAGDDTAELEPGPAVQVEPELEPVPPVSTQPEPEPAPEPVEETAAPVPEPEPLPDLADSDAVVLAAVDQLDPEEAVSDMIVSDDVLMKSVRAVIALAGGNVVHEYRPVKSPAGDFLVEKLPEPPTAEMGQRYRLSPQNYERYDPYVDVITRLDSQNVAEVYRRFYPLLEEAYAQHGVDRGSFKQVTLNAIDLILKAPVLKQEPVLIQPKVHFQFEDAQLEKLPGPQKLMIRMGPENTRQVQAALREIRQAIAAVEVPEQGN